MGYEQSLELKAFVMGFVRYPTHLHQAFASVPSTVLIHTHDAKQTFPRK